MAINVRVGMPLADFIAESNTQVFELIHGERVPKMPTVAGHNESLDTLYMRLRAHTDTHDLGLTRSEATFVLPDGYDEQWVTGSRTPDVMFITKARIEAYRAAHPDWREKPYLIVPDFVAEIISPNDSFSDVDEKVDVYLADGVRLIWIIDPQRRKAFFYTPDDDPQRLVGTGELSGEDVIPGFTVRLETLVG
ncbi:MAG: Uma2 family endonuclease [Chloroflexota bacterium]|nr:Uma2 family endonuclease [Chloroflexota bacterium]